MKKLFCFALAVIFIFSCDFISLSDNSSFFNEFNKRAVFEEIDFLEHAKPIVFGTSTTRDGNSIAYGPLGIGANRIPEGWIELRAESGGSGGKIAGSEDGITFYYKEVSTEKLFFMEADFRISVFGPPSAANGQEGWGIMARDYIPNWTSAEGGGANAVDWETIENITHSLNVRNSYTYWAGNRGGDSNMIMVGGVKRGVRIYWREGVQWNGTTPLTNGQSGNPMENAYMDHSSTIFNYTPREYPDYTPWPSTNPGNQFDLSNRPDFPSTGSEYTIRLEKTNNGFYYKITAKTPDKGFMYLAADNTLDLRTVEEGIIPLYNMDTINKEYYYVGLFAARDARVWVDAGSIKYGETDKNDAPPFIPPEAAQLSSLVEVVSPPFYTGNDYLYVKAAMLDGTLAVIQNGVEIPQRVITSEWIGRNSNGGSEHHTLFTVPTLPMNDGDNVFHITFYPNRNLHPDVANLGIAGTVLASSAPVQLNFIVNKKIFGEGTGDIYVSPDGSPRNSGDITSPLDLQTAINYVQPGQDIIMLNGLYNMRQSVVIPRYNNGRFNAYKTLRAQDPTQVITGKADYNPDDQVFIDWNKTFTIDILGQGILLAGNYWILDGIHIRNTPDKIKGIVVSGHNNILRRLKVYANGDTGVQISGNSREAFRYWPSNNLVEYCESFGNMDGPLTDADGFAAKLTVGEHNRFNWCVAHNNVDDGWDLFAKKETGHIGVVTVENSISYYNGIVLTDGIRNDLSNGPAGRPGAATRNGFKMGGEGISVRHILRQSLAFLNDGNPVTSNSNPSLRVFDFTGIHFDGDRLGDNEIRSGDTNAPDGIFTRTIGRNRAANSGDYSVAGNVESWDFDSILHSRKYDIIYGKYFLEYEDVNGFPVPVLNNVYKSDAQGMGAWVFYQ